MKISIKLWISTAAIVGMMGSLVVAPTQTVGQPSTAQQQELAEAEKLNQQLIELYKQGKYSEAIPCGFMV